MNYTFHLRRRPGHEPIPSFDNFVGCNKRDRLDPDFAEKYGAHPDDMTSVLQFCDQQKLNVVKFNPRSRMVTVSSTVDEAECAFDTQIHDHEKDHPHLGRYTFQVHEPLKVPRELHDSILAVGGLNTEHRAVKCSGTFPGFPGVPSSVGALTPQQVSAFYNNVGITAPSQNIAVWGFNEVAADVIATLQAWGFGTTPTIIDILCDPQVTNPGSSTPSEGTLDCAMVIAFGGGVVGTVANYYASLSTANGLVEIMDRVLHPQPGDPVCNIFTGSAGFVNNFEQSMLSNPAFTQANEALFEDAAILGVTLLASTGDSGSYTGDPNSPFVIYPASSPWFTAVGGTTIGNISGNISNINSLQWLEWPWNDDPGKSDGGASGGGVSIVFPTPTYQTGFVPGSLNTHNPGFLGRGIPDISGNASAFSGYNIHGGGTQQVIGGTSASTPQTAGCLAQVNQYLGYNIGFINPTLYFLQNFIRNGNVATASGVDFLDASGIRWGLISTPSNPSIGLQVTKNHVIDPSTSNVLRLIYTNPPANNLYYLNSSGNWFIKSPPSVLNWTAITPPVSQLSQIRKIGSSTGGPTNNGTHGIPGYQVSNTTWDPVTGWGVINYKPFAFFLQNFQLLLLGSKFWFQVNAFNSAVAGPTVIAGPYTSANQTITIQNPTTSGSGPFPVQGTMTGFTAIPLLNYVDDDGTLQPLTNVNTVTTTSFSFLHPGMAVGHHVLWVRAGTPGQGVFPVGGVIEYDILPTVSANAVTGVFNTFMVMNCVMSVANPTPAQALSNVDFTATGIFAQWTAAATVTIEPLTAVGSMINWRIDAANTIMALTAVVTTSRRTLASATNNIDYVSVVAVQNA